ncbi:MAG: phosphotransferase [Gammaproteobacteria bacterium]|nr:MAG: phosphotransferase [Gammaproteobacteria bacterium]
MLRTHFGVDARAIEPLGAGLINQTFLVTSRAGDQFVLQQLHDIFPAEINEDIEIVTAHLAKRGLPTPRLKRTSDGRLWLERDGHVWRMMTYVPGSCVERIETGDLAYQAGALLARFHLALADLEHDFAHARGGIHDTPRHLRNLALALENHREHPAFDRIEPLADSILEAASRLEPLPDTPPRVVHGDPKITNFIFDLDSGRGVCIVDLDTLNRTALPLEMGDALRSWCNPAGEDAMRTGFSAELFQAALEGYRNESRDWLTHAETSAFGLGTMTILVELAARFCADALNESYFGWDPERFPDRSEHNRVRAAGQLAAYRDFLAKRDRLERIIGDVFGGGDHC